MMDSQVRRRAGERGSALLIVFVMAAAVAILLYTELPVAAFEAQRQREQTLVDRGNEYAHAVKLYLRKVGRYPPTLDALEDTNRMRFLRHRFKDPFTGKDDWRLLHAGPGGMLIDSKVKQATVNLNGGTGGGSPIGAATANNTSASTSFAGSTTGSGFAGSNDPFSTPPSSSTSSQAAEVVVPPIRQRPPAVAANGGSVSAGGRAAADANADSTAASLLSTTPETVTAAAGQPEAGQTGAPSVGSPATGVPGAGLADAHGQAAGPEGSTLQLQANAQTVDTGGAVTPGSSAVNAAGLRSVNSGGLTAGGGIAGVASKASGRTIKTINDQTDYSLWEFYYDPSKDLARLGLTGQTSYQSTPAGGTGQTGTNSGFGNSNQTTAPQTNGTGQTSGFGLGNSNSINAPGNAPNTSSFPSGPVQNPGGPQPE